MSLLQAIILGIVQGLTEFIPVSSTAHLVLAGRVMKLTMTPEQLTASIGVIQLGTLIAVFVYFAGDIWSITRAFVRDHLTAFTGKQGTAGGLVVALLLTIAEFVGKQRRSMQELRIRDALAVGFAQVLALIPGSSRSGSTIMAGLFVGEARETAARFSFLLSIPAVAASGLLELKEAIHKLPPDSLTTLAVGTIVSGIVGYATIWFLLRYLRTHTTGVFIGYRLLVGGTILFLLFSGRLAPL